MKDFEFWSPTRFVLAKDADLLCGQEVKKYSDNVLFVHYGDDFTYKSGLHGRITGALNEAGITCFELPGVQPNPKAGLVRKGVEICKRENIGCVLAVGGGSVIDTAKAVAIGAKYDGDVWDFYTKKAIPVDALPIGTIMTLPATGSEASNGSVLNDGITLDVMSDIIRPSFTLMNPDLTLTIPKSQTVYGIIDMFSHVMERYFSTSRNAEITDRMCEGVMKAIITNAGRLMENMNDPEIRAEFMWISIVAHNGILAVGRNQDWATHAMAAQLSAEYNTVHGAALSVLFPQWAKYVYKDNLPRFVQFAHRVFNIDVDFDNPEKTAMKGIDEMRAFFDYLGAPNNLRGIGITTHDKFSTLAGNVCKFGNVGGIKALNATDVERIYFSAM